MTATQTTSLEAATYDQAWDVAVKCQKDGLGDIQAIQKVWNFMPPPATLRSLATIIGAIYADSYWVRTRMDYTILSASLQQAGGWNKYDCDQAAQIAFSNWYGLLVRNDFSNVGQIPKQGVLTNSPDVLCNGSGPLDPSLMLGKWNSRFYNQVPGTKNYTYGRVQSVNIPVNIQQPTLRMFATDAGFNQPPASWTVLYTFDGQNTSPLQGIQPGPLSAGARAANTSAFNFQPLGTGHYCLMAVAGTEFFTNNPLQGTGNWDSQAWINNNGAAGWHNFDTTSANEELLKFYNQDGRPEQFAFETHCINLPAGTRVSLECNDVRLAQAIASGPVTVAHDYQVVSVESEVPANFASDLVVRFATPDGKPLPAVASIEVRMLWILHHGHTHYDQAVEHLGAHRAAAAAQPVRLQMGNYTFVGPAD